MIKIVLFGSGNVATQLAKAFLKSDAVKIIQVFSRNNSIPFLKNHQIEIINDLQQLKKADIYLIAISDDAIASFSQKIPFKNVLTVHTSGAVPLQVITAEKKGVFYPLQSISKSKKINFKKVPICIEASSKKDRKLLKKLAKSISDKVYKIDSEQRKNLHVAAVFVNNFVNHLYAIAEEICVEKNVPFKILQPLIKETAKKTEKLSPYQAQTGPAKRRDKKTIAKHVKLLNEEQQKIYKLLTSSITKKHSKK